MRIQPSTLSLLLLLCFIAPSRPSAQEPSRYEEVVFGFTLKELGSYNISVAVRDDRIYLPVMELFNIFGIYYTIESHNVIKGTYLSSAFPLMIDPVNSFVAIGDRRFALPENEVIAGGMDLYISTKKFEEIFGVASTVNHNRLLIMAETSRELPAIVRRRMEVKRSEIGSVAGKKERYPVRFDRRRSIADGAIIDYNVTTFLNRYSWEGTSYTVTGGAEAAGGDLQGTVTGAIGHDPSFNDVRWRYAVRDNRYFSSLAAGQIRTGSVYVPGVTGIALSNEPIEPRVMFDDYVVDGYTESESDVELYLNDRLVDFQKANAAGYYRFLFPLTYGTVRIAVKTFSKYGDINVSERQLQVPFSFVPERVLTYNLQAGKTSDTTPLSYDDYFGNLNLLYGATDWLTLKAGMERNRCVGLGRPIFELGLSSRLFSRLIVNMNAAPEAYYRVDANALFASNADISVQYTRYELNDSSLGFQPEKQNASLALYLPLRFLSSGTAFRVSEGYTDAGSTRRLSTRIDLSTRLAGTQLLLGYSGFLSGTDEREMTMEGNGLLTATAMYALPRGPFLPGFLQGFLLRGSATFDLETETFLDADVQLSKTFMRSYRFNFGFSRNFPDNRNMLHGGLIVDLDFTRVSSNFYDTKETSSSRHSLYGSVGLDRGAPFLINREQAGKGGVDVMLFVDNNGNDAYDAGDEPVPAKGIKVDGMGKMERRRNGAIRVSQLQNYFRYNLEVDRRQIDPDLVPKIDRFSFVVDPNQFKRIEIPFYRGGTITGAVCLENKGVRTPLGGTRIILEQSPRGVSVDTIRTFADGEFYAMNIAPGSYTLTVDPAQRIFLHVVQKNGPLGVEVRHTPEGDLIDSCDIVLMKPAPGVALEQKRVIRRSVPKPEPVSKPPKAVAAEKTAEGSGRIAVRQPVSPGVPDADRDGVPDAHDKCPDESEDMDGVEDGDGCPDYDQTDIQKFLSNLQESKTVVKTVEGVDMPRKEADRFTMSDTDGDGIPDSLDKCPYVPEDIDGVEDRDGCPDYDQTDIQKFLSKLPETGAEEKTAERSDRPPPSRSDLTPPQRTDRTRTPERSVQTAPVQTDRTGMPDTDWDGVPDALDKCPYEPEDMDGFEDGDGCPDPDNRAAKVRRTPLVLNPVMFEKGQGRFTRAAEAILDQMAMSLLECKDVRLEIQGHADISEKNPDLSLQRAEFVRSYLIYKGVPAERMRARGYGTTRPLSRSPREADRSKNRRVEFRPVN